MDPKTQMNARQREQTNANERKVNEFHTLLRTRFAATQ